MARDMVKNTSASPLRREGDMSQAGTHRVRVHFLCNLNHMHELAVAVPRGVPPELRAPEAQPAGFGGGGGGCPIPADLVDRVIYALRDALEEHRRHGFVLIRI